MQLILRCSKVLQKLLCRRAQGQLLTMHQHQLSAGQFLCQRQRKQIAGMLRQTVIGHKGDAEADSRQGQKQVITGQLDFRNQHQLDLVPEIELSSNDLLLDLATIGLGIAFVPDYCLPNHSSDLFPLTLAEELPSRQLMLVHSEQLPLSPAAKQFLEYFTA